MQITINTSEIKDLIRYLDEKQRVKIPETTAKAINSTSNQARQKIYAEMRRVFDRPTPYTLRSVWINYATKEKLFSEIYINNEAAKGNAPIKFLWAETEGGKRQQKGIERLMTAAGYMRSDEYLLPWKAKKDQYGNVSAGTIQRILSGLQAQSDDYQNSPGKGGDYKGTRKGRRVARRYYIDDWYRQHKGMLIIWQHDTRSNRRVPLFVSNKGVKYRRRLRFKEIVQETTERVLVTEFIRGL